MHGKTREDGTCRIDKNYAMYYNIRQGTMRMPSQGYFFTGEVKMKRIKFAVVFMAIAIVFTLFTGCAEKDVRPSYEFCFYGENQTVISEVTLKRGERVLPPECEEKAGYDAVWTDEEGERVNFPVTATGDKNFFLKYELNKSAGRCRVETYLQRDDGTFAFLPDKTEYLEQPVNCEVSIIPPQVEGYVFDSGNSENVLSGINEPGTELVFRIYYRRA